MATTTAYDAHSDQRNREPTIRPRKPPSTHRFDFLCVSSGHCLPTLQSKMHPETVFSSTLVFVCLLSFWLTNRPASSLNLDHETEAFFLTRIDPQVTPLHFFTKLKNGPGIFEIPIHSAYVQL